MEPGPRPSRRPRPPAAAAAAKVKAAQVKAARAARAEKPMPRSAPRLPLAVATGRTQVVAHRGASDVAAEHTLAAYTHAIDCGADALECDIRMTRDGHLVCVHDRRVNRTSDGRGVVSGLELADLADLDFGSWKDALQETSSEEPDTDRTGVLTLRRLLELIVDTASGVQLHIETKHPTRYAGKVERVLIELLDYFGLRSPARTADSAVLCMSFAPTSLRRVRTLAPQLPTVLLVDRLPLLLRDGLLPPYADIAGPSLQVLTDHPRFVERVHRGGARVHCWTVDEATDVERVLALGVDAVITNRPEQVLTRLGRGRR